jgi:folate-binding protein YgfZ
MPAAHLTDRGVVRVAGADARAFLQGIVTCDMAPVEAARAGYGALLTPQGKIIGDFLIAAVPEAEGGGFLLDMPRPLVPDVMKRLRLYKLRAKVALDDLSESCAVLASDDGSALDAEAGLVFADPRLQALGQRAIADAGAVSGLATGDAERYHARRIALGVPEGGKDFVYGDVFPHEALLDQTGGVSFGKGCYVGQEVVSRMQHRGTARTRIVPVVFADGVVPEPGIEAVAGTRTLGHIGSGAAGRALAKLRLDRVADALAGGETPMAGGLAFTLAKPDFVRFPFPGEPGFGAAA